MVVVSSPPPHFFSSPEARTEAAKANNVNDAFMMRDGQMLERLLDVRRARVVCVDEVSQVRRTKV